MKGVNREQRGNRLLKGISKSYEILREFRNFVMFGHKTKVCCASPPTRWNIKKFIKNSWKFIIASRQIMKSLSVP